MMKKRNARAGSKPYWIAYIDGYGEPSYAKIQSADEEREYGRVIARSYKASIVKKAARAAIKRQERGLSNPKRRKTKKRARRLMRSGSKKLAAYVRSQANRRRRKKNAARRKKNPVRVGAQVVGSGTGWIKAKAVKVRKVKGKGYVVDVKR